MSQTTKEKAYLVLSDGTVFTGKPMGARGETTGEVVFTTGMTGYLETLTDPSYFGQIAVQTFPLIGNYGVNEDDAESAKIHMRGYIVRQWCDVPSNFRSQMDIDTYLKKHGVIGLWDIDTRALTRRIREQGVMNGAITQTLDGLNALLEKIRAFEIKGAVEGVSDDRVHEYSPEAPKRHVVLYDYGYKRNIRRELLARNCSVTVVPGNTSAEDVLKLRPDGIMLSNGPGDPAENTGIIEQLKKLMTSGVPMFGICLGHQLLALAAGAKTEKLKYGHRGANQPAVELSTGKVYVTSQNHGYAVMGDTLPQSVGRVSYINANDKTCEGVDYTAFPAFTVQFHPEACGGPHDTRYLFDRFISAIDEKRCLKCR